MNIRFAFLIVGFIVMILMFLFIGIAYDSEFHEPNIIIKYKPSIKMKFSSPIGESDLTLNDLDDCDKREELAYQDCVIKNKNNSLNGDIVALILSQIVLTSLTFGLFLKKGFKILKILGHYFFNIIFLFIGLLLIYHFNGIWATILILMILILINMMTVRWIEIKVASNR